jgi:hypothetical protein
MRLRWVLVCVLFLAAGCGGSGEIDKDRTAILLSIISLVFASTSIVFTAAKFVWDIYQFRALRQERQKDKEEAKKAREQKEKEKVVLNQAWEKTRHGLTWTVRIYNTCDHPLPLKRVELEVDEPDGTTNAHAFFTTREIIRVVSGSHKTTPAKTEAGIPGHGEIDFLLLPGAEDSLRPLVNYPPDSFHIVARSPAGEVGRLDGFRVWRAVRSYVGVDNSDAGDGNEAAGGQGQGPGGLEPGSANSSLRKS